jgi:hypothetical protein
MKKAAFIFAIALLGTAPVLAATPLDGWNGYKFGLSPDAARAVPGMVFGPYSAKNLMNEDKGAMAAKKDVSLYSFAWTLDLFFNAGQKLDAINLENERKFSRQDCEKNFLTVLTQLEKSYGALTAVNPERKRNDADTPPTSLEWRMWGASRYQFATVALAAQFQSLVAVVLGTTLGMMIANVPAVLLGDRIAHKIPVRLVHGIAALIFIVLGALVLSGVGHDWGL